MHTNENLTVSYFLKRFTTKWLQFFEIRKQLAYYTVVVFLWSGVSGKHTPMQSYLSLINITYWSKAYAKTYCGSLILTASTYHTDLYCDKQLCKRNANTIIIIVYHNSLSVRQYNYEYNYSCMCSLHKHCTCSIVYESQRLTAQMAGSCLTPVAVYVCSLSV